MLVNCKLCNMSFNKLPSQIKKSKSGFHFCSHTCSAKYNNKNRTRKDNIEEKFCKLCKTPFKTSFKLQKCCCHRCSSEYRIKVKTDLLEEGGVSTAYQCKKYYIRNSPFCSVCRIDEWNGKDISLELDHIDGDGTNNTLSNTRLICPNCHSQTPNYKFKNATNPRGKRHRRKRYQKRLK